MKQIKTAEEILQHHYVHDRGLNNPEYAINAMRAYAEQFINAAADIIEFETEYNAETFKADIVGSAKKILQLKEHLK